VTEEQTRHGTSRHRSARVRTTGAAGRSLCGSRTPPASGASVGAPCGSWHLALREASSSACRPSQNTHGSSASRTPTLRPEHTHSIRQRTSSCLRVLASELARNQGGMCSPTARYAGRLKSSAGSTPPSTANMLGAALCWELSTACASQKPTKQSAHEVMTHGSSRGRERMRTPHATTPHHDGCRLAPGVAIGLFCRGARRV
jgi:hypothetical protein